MLRIEPKKQQNGKAFAFAMLFESGLGFAGIALAWLLEVPIYSRLEVTPDALARGVLASIVLLSLFGMSSVSSWAPFVRLRHQVEALVRELFVASHWIELALISLAAGLGEELLFRGAIQPWLEGVSHPLIALCLVSLMFGFAHSLSATYFVAATITGFFLGWLAMEYDDLVAPILAHALYDFVALLYVQRRVRG